MPICTYLLWLAEQYQDLVSGNVSLWMPAGIQQHHCSNAGEEQDLPWVWGSSQLSLELRNTPLCLSETLQSNCHVRESKETTIIHCLLKQTNAPHSSLIVTDKHWLIYSRYWNKHLFLFTTSPPASLLPPVPEQEPEWFNSPTFKQCFQLPTSN